MSKLLYQKVSYAVIILSIRNERALFLIIQIFALIFKSYFTVDIYTFLSRLFCLRIYEVTTLFPDSEKFGLKSQISRCVISIPANIAEGCAKDSQKDFVRFLQISLGSAFELFSVVVTIWLHSDE